ncbi:LLM class flavin-dependent oxidoreductase [Myxococcota bacterium]|nr:LLM class flavin-dependent oxidoreductase [Myxococcota bacterium]
MPSLNLRYDLRAPSFGKASSAELCQTALDQCEWADRLGFASILLLEHHGSPDGYLPSPLVMAGAVAARTQRVRICLSALIAPLHDPVRIAEDMAIVDVISGGRLFPTLSGGYVAKEFEGFGKKLSDRRDYMEEIVPFLEKAWTGEPFEWKGRTVRVTPRPVQTPRPPIFLGGSSAPAARRAARMADGFAPTAPSFHEIYREELRKLGKPDPGPLPPTLPHSFIHVSQDPDAAWAQIAPHAMHEMNAYAKWIEDAGTDAPYFAVDNVDELRASGQYAVFTPDEFAEKLRELGPTGSCTLNPLMGGLDPVLSWQSLHLIESEVLPRLER